MQIVNNYSQVSNSNTIHSNHASNSLKIFYSSLHNLIPKMSNPDPSVRLQAVDTALDLLRPIPINSPL